MTIGLGHGLDEKSVEIEPLRFLAHLFASERGDEHDGRLLRERLVALNETACLETIHPGMRQS
jgi:hypothetical protein